MKCIVFKNKVKRRDTIQEVTLSKEKMAHAPERIGTERGVVPREELRERVGDLCKQRSEALHEEGVQGKLLC